MKKTLLLVICIVLVFGVFSATAFAQTKHAPDQNISTYELNGNQSLEIYNEIYNENPVIEYATPAGISTMASNLPYPFTFEFDSNLYSSTLNNTSSTVKIHASATWQQEYAEEDWGATTYNYFDITLKDSGGNSLGTFRYPVDGTSYVGTWTNVPTGNIHFVMSKH